MSHLESKDGTRLFYKSWGEGRPVVLVHGWPLTADTWDEIALDLAESGFHVVAYDRRGFGRSDQPWNGYDYDTLTDDLHAVIDHLRLEDCSLVGFSMGGGEIARYGQRYPNSKIQSLVFIGSIVPNLAATPNHEGVSTDVFEKMKRELSANRPDFFSNFVVDFFGSTTVSEATLQWYRAMCMQASLKGALDCIDSFAYTDFRADLMQTTSPCLFIHGMQDTIVPVGTTSVRAAELVSNSQLVEIPNASHGMLVTHRLEISKLLKEFLLASSIPQPMLTTSK